jgi:epoxyqueuosine reductase
MSSVQPSRPETKQSGQGGLQRPAWIGEPRSKGVSPLVITSRQTRRVQEAARASGLMLASVTSAESFPGLSEFLADHIERGRMEGLEWFTSDRAAFSAEPRNLHQTARSIISVGLPYRVADTGKPDDGVTRGRISRYAWGEDYHRVLKRRMKQMHHELEQAFGRPIESRQLVDTARIVDRAVAARSGLGWYGKHSCIIVPGYGSWVMLGEMVLDLELEPSQSLPNDCGRCRICIDNCPTGAIEEPYKVNTSRCLSFQTIEQRERIPHELRSSLGDWVFGCDICQEVCPYTGAAATVEDPEVSHGSVQRRYPSLGWLLEMSEDEFRSTYARSAVLRTKRRGLARNAAVALANVGHERDMPVMTRALHHHDEPLVREHLAWSLGQFECREARTALGEALNRESDPSVRDEIARALEG